MSSPPSCVCSRNHSVLVLTPVRPPYLWAGSLQRDPNSEEPEAPLVEAGIPHRLAPVAPVVDWRRRRPVRWRERSAPGRRRRCSPAPWSGSVAPGSTVESTVPTVSPGVTRRSAALVTRPVLRRRRLSRPGTALRRGCRLSRPRTALRRGWRAVIRLAWDDRWRVWSGGCYAGIKTNGGQAESRGDCCYRDLLLHLHRAIPVLWTTTGQSPRQTPTGPTVSECSSL